MLAVDREEVWKFAENLEGSEAGCEADGSDVGEEGSVDGSADISKWIFFIGYCSVEDVSSSPFMR